MDALLNSVVAFFDHPLFSIIGGVAVVLATLGIVYRVVSWFFGITPVVIRFGTALWRRRVAVFGSADAYASLKATIVGSNIFNSDGVIHIPLDDIDAGKGETLFLVDWESAGSEIDQILATRSSNQTAVVIFAKPASIPPEKMADIANRANTVVVNFRGRLLNDILTSLVTTSYER